MSDSEIVDFYECQRCGKIQIRHFRDVKNCPNCDGTMLAAAFYEGSRFTNETDYSNYKP